MIVTPRFRRFFGLALLSLQFLLLLATGSAHAVFHYPPAINTEAEKVSWLMYVQKHIPWLFKDAAGFDSDVFGLIESEQRLIAALASHEPFQRQAAARPELQKIQVDVTEAQTVNSKRLKASAGRTWKSQIRALLESYASQGGASLASVVDAKVSALLERLLGQDPKGMIIGLINSIPNKEERPAIFQLPPREQVAALRASGSLTDEALARSFRAQAFGLQPSDVSKEGLLSRVEALLDAESELLTAAQLKKVTELAGAGASKEQILARLEKATGPELNIFEQAKPQNLAFATKLVADSVQEPGLVKRATAYVQRTWQSALKGQYDAVQRTVKVVTGDVTLVEVPPFMAIFRGFIGGDCSTSYSWAYPYNPLEKVFFIYEKGQLKGYISGLVVQMGDQPTYYVRDLTGTRLTATTGELALYGLYGAMEEMGAKRVAVSTEGRANGNNHFAHLIAVLKKYRDTSPGQESLIYPSDDSAIRTTLNGYVSSSGYDAESGNNLGFEFQPLPEILAKIKVKAGTAKPPAYSPQQITTDSAIQLATEFQGGGRTAVAQRIAVSGGLTVEKWSEYLNLIRNPNRLELDAFYTGIAEWLQANGASDGPGLVAAKLKTFSVGHMNAPDAFTTQKPEYLKVSIEMASELIRNNYWTNIPVYDRVRERPEAFTQNAVFQQLMSTMIEPLYYSLRKLVALVEAGVVYRGLPDRMEELAAMMSTGDLNVRESVLRLFAQSKDLDPGYVALVVAALDADQDQAIQAAIVLSRQSKISEETAQALRSKIDQEANAGLLQETIAVALFRAGDRSEKVMQLTRVYLGQTFSTQNISGNITQQARIDLQNAIRPEYERASAPGEGSSCEALLANAG